MDLNRAIETRISCRSYADLPIEQEKLDRLQRCIDTANTEAGLHFQLFGPREDEAGRQYAALDMNPRMFAGTVYHYAALVGHDDELTREKVGYYGEKLVLLATLMGLGTCWVASTFDRDTCRADIGEDEILYDVVPLGYAMGKTPFKQKTIRAGLRRHDKSPAQMVETDLAELPRWFEDAIAAVIKGPSAINEQPVTFVYRAGRITAEVREIKRGREIEDLGIAKLHFEIGSGERGTWQWGNGAEFVLNAADSVNGTI